MTSRGNLRIPTAIVIAALLGGFVATRFEFSADITDFLPTADDREDARLARKVAEGPASRTMILALSAEDTARAVTASRMLEAALLGDPDVGPQLESLRGGPPLEYERALWDLYHPRRFGFIAQDAQQARARTSDASLKDSADRLIRRLRQPDSPLLARLVPSDPLLALPDLFRRFEQSSDRELQVVDGRFVTSDGHTAVLFMATKASAFDSKVQRPLLQGVQKAFGKVQAQMQGTLTLQQSGINRFAVRAEETIRSDIQRITWFSVIGLTALLWLLFRSVRLVFLAALPVLYGVLAGCAVTLCVVDRVHGITLAFGASLIGVCVDYVIHLYCHHAVTPHPDGPFRTLSTIWKALVTGAATTMIGFTALGWSSFEGLREVAIFSSSGVLAALLATRYLIPALLPHKPKPVVFRERLVGWLERAFVGLQTRRAIVVVMLMFILGLIAIGAPELHWNDDFASLNRLDGDLLAEDTAVRSKVTKMDQMRFVVAVGATEEAALQVNDALAASLVEAVQENEINSYRSVAHFLPSAEQQRDVDTAFRESPNLWGRLSAAYAQAGIQPASLEPFRKALSAAPAPPLSYSDLVASPLSPMIASSRVDLDEGVGWVTFLSGVRDVAALKLRLAAIPSVEFVDQASLLRQANRAYQQRTLQLILVGLLGVFLMLAIRYREPRTVAAALVPALLAAAVTLAVLALKDQGVDLVALTALLVVVSIGVDYGVFLVDADKSSATSRSAALLSVTVAWGSTVLGFGLLSLSDYPALHTIGLTALIGVTACFVLAPAALVLAKEKVS